MSDDDESDIEHDEMEYDAEHRIGRRPYLEGGAPRNLRRDAELDDDEEIWRESPNEERSSRPIIDRSPAKSSGRSSKSSGRSSKSSGRSSKSSAGAEEFLATLRNRPPPFMKNIEFTKRIDDMRVKDVDRSDVENFLDRIWDEIENYDENNDKESDIGIRKEQWDAQQRLRLRELDSDRVFPRRANDKEWKPQPVLDPRRNGEAISVDARRRRHSKRKTPIKKTELPIIRKQLNAIEDKSNLYPIPVMHINNFPCYSRSQLNDLNHLLQKNILSPWLRSEITPVIKDGNVVGFLGGPPWHIWEDLIENAIRSMTNERPSVVREQSSLHSDVRRDFNIPEGVDAVGYLRDIKGAHSVGGMTRFYIEKEYRRSNILLKVREGVSKKKIIYESPRKDIQLGRWKQSVWEWDFPNPQWKSAVKKALVELQSVLYMTKLNSKAFLQKRNELTAHLEQIRNRIQPIEATDTEPSLAPRKAPRTNIVNIYNDLTNKVIEWNSEEGKLNKKYVSIDPDAKDLIKNPTNYFKSYYKNILQVAQGSEPFGSRAAIGNEPFGSRANVVSVPDRTVHIIPILKNMRVYDHLTSGSKVTINISDVIEYLGDSYYQFCEYKYGTYEKPDGTVMYLDTLHGTYSQVPKYTLEETKSYYIVGPNLHSEEVSTKGARRLALLLGIDISKIPPWFSIRPEDRAAALTAPITKEDVMLYFKRDGRHLSEAGAKNLDENYRKALRSVLKKGEVGAVALGAERNLNVNILNNFIKEMNKYKTKKEKELYIDTIRNVPLYFNYQKQLQLESIINNFNELLSAANGLTFKSFINLSTMQSIASTEGRTMRSIESVGDRTSADSPEDRRLRQQSADSSEDRRLREQSAAVGKQCNPKSPKANNPLYRCNPVTGRWVLR